MNPIVYNKNGQFRFTDFVGYLPEFLRSEPDVVTYLQVMSDYINNAYRNVDVTEEFELVKVCTSTDRVSVQKMMEKLCNLFKLAGDRKEPVMYLSVPRNNIKSNVILGNSEAEYVRSIDVDYDDIVDTLESASRRIGGADAAEDGDIIYVNYVKRKQAEMIAYYYVKDSDILRIDSMASSQDPFTGTYNNPTTAIQFGIVDVGNVICRYGGTHGDIIYYEVYFTLHVTNVQRVSASGLANCDVNLDGKEDTIFVDYYNLNATTNVDDGSYHTYIKFADSRGFAWTGNFPNGMFYFRDSSNTYNLSADKSKSMDIVDTLISPTVDKYRIARVEKMSGIYRVFMDVFPGIYANAVFYIMNGTRSCGAYRMNGLITGDSRFDGGEVYIDLVNISNENFDSIILDETNSLTLVSIPLAESKYVVNYDDSMPLVKWSKEITGLDEASIGSSSNIMMRRASVQSNGILYSGKVERYASDCIQISLQRSVSIFAGQRICSMAFQDKNDNVSPYYATVTSVKADYATGRYRIYFDNTETGVNMSALQSSDNIDIVAVDAGFLTRLHENSAPDSRFVYFDAEWNESLPIKKGDVVKADFADGERLLTVSNLRYEDIGHGQRKGTIQFEKPVNYTFPYTTSDLLMVPVSRVSVNKEYPATAYRFSYVRKTETNSYIGAVKQDAYEGDLFSADNDEGTSFYMLANLIGSKEVSLLVMDTDVVRRMRDENGQYVVYPAGQYVYDSDRKIKRLVRITDTNAAGDVLDENAAVIDKIAHYSVGFVKVSNTFMPYCGPVSMLDYEEHPNYDGNMKTARLPLYIKKVNDVRLKYGWNQRQYVYYNDNIGISDKARAGFMEIYEDGDDRNPVSLNLRKNANVLPANALRYGCGSQFYQVEVDTPPIAQRADDGTWTITVTSSGHGLSTGVSISATVDVGDSDPEEITKKLVFETQDARIVVLSPDVFQYSTSPSGVDGYVVRLGGDDQITLTYDRSYTQSVAGSVGYPVAGDVVVVGAKSVQMDDVPNYEYRDDTYPLNTSYSSDIWVGGTLYQVTDSEWIQIDPTEMLTPTTIYCRHNLFDESVSNPTFAMGDGYVIHSIEKVGSDTAEIQTAVRITELDMPNAADVYNGKGRVYIEFVNNGAVCGWHTIKEVHNGGAFSIYIDGNSFNDQVPVLPITNRKMTVHLGRWYKYTLFGYDWDKKSNLTSYVTTTKIMELVEGYTNRIKTKYAHRLEIGDHVIIDPTGTTIYNVDDSNVGSLLTSTVVSVIDEYTVELDESTDLTNNLGYIFRGYVVTDKNIGRLRGEYSISVDGKIVKLKTNDVVVTMAQVCLDERHAWRVTANTAWIPMSRKRTMKISRMTVDLQHNPAYDIGDDFDTEAEYRYVTYSDVDAFSDVNAFRIGYADARNYHFEHPYVENLDTTQKTELEYSSKYDYATVAPRDGMDPSFSGVPDMGYPLAERIERLAYLRDPEVIDIDLIGYLARFMGYDITAVADDIRSSNMYRNSAEREAAIRETIAHLPQFYALNGTKPGINMLMATFGLVGELITQWTNTDDPYGKLIRQDEVNDQMDADQMAGRITSSWVPTPHVTLDIIENENFNSVLMGNEELGRMKEQIRRCKPINVVFDGIRVVFNREVNISSSIAIGGGELADTTVLLLPDQEAAVSLETDPCMDEDCDF